MSITKDYSDTYLYNKGNYENKIFNFIMHSEFIKNDDEIIKEISNDLKRLRSGSYLVKVLTSPNTHICIGGEALPRAFKQFVAKDIRGQNKNKKVLYIDLTGLITKEGNSYKYRRGDLNIIASYLLGGMISMIYFVSPDKLINNNSILEDGCKCFSSLVYYIIDYLRLSSDIKVKGRIIYLASKYYMLNILNKEMSDSIENRALKIAKISEQESNVINMMIEQVDDPYHDISTFVKCLSIITRSDRLTLDVFVDKWMYHIGVGTQFALEVFPAFANVFLYAYMGAYLNHQKTIEKCVGKPMISFVNILIGIGGAII